MPSKIIEIRTTLCRIKLLQIHSEFGGAMKKMFPLLDGWIWTERTKKMVEGNVPFLVITQKLNDAIFDFNVIKHQVQSKNDTDSFISLFQTVLDKVGRNKINIFFKIIQQNRVQGEEIKVETVSQIINKTNKKNTRQSCCSTEMMNYQKGFIVMIV